LVAVAQASECEKWAEEFFVWSDGETKDRRRLTPNFKNQNDE
jgi:hypothetical protein